MVNFLNFFAEFTRPQAGDSCLQQSGGLGRGLFRGVYKGATGVSPGGSRKRAGNTRCHRAVTLIELVAVLVVLGIAGTSLVVLLAEVSRISGVSELRSKASFCASSRIERALSKGFLGVDTLAGIESDAEASGLTRNTTVSYCRLNGAAWIIDPGPTEYKLVTVTVTRPGYSDVIQMHALLGDYTG